MLIVTPKAGKAVDSLYDKKQLRLLLMVEGWAMQLLHHVCDRLLVSRRSVKSLSLRDGWLFVWFI